MIRALLFAFLASTVAITVGCPQHTDSKSASEKKKKKKKAPRKERDDDDNDADGHPDLPRPKPVDDDVVMNELKAENAALKIELQTGKTTRIPNAINVHEHLYRVKDLDKYLPAARKQGVATTVILSSSNFTLEGKRDQKGEPSMSKNFENVVLDAAKKYPGEIVPFCTLDPKDPDKLERLKKHVAMGCKGLKLYSGHSNFYDGPLDAADMDPIYSYLEQTQLPVLWHVHLGKYMDEFERVMKKHGKMNLLVPHYGVTFWRPNDGNMERFEAILRTHKNIYTDTSLGTRQILTDGMAAMEPELDKFRAFFTEFQDQICWGTDSVITGNHEKTPGWYEKVIATTRDDLEKTTFTTDLAAAFSKYYQKGRDGDGRYAGLGISPEILHKVYVDNPKRWLKLK